MLTIPPSSNRFVDILFKICTQIEKKKKLNVSHTIYSQQTRSQRLNKHIFFPPLKCVCHSNCFRAIWFSCRFCLDWKVISKWKWLRKWSKFDCCLSYWCLFFFFVQYFVSFLFPVRWHIRWSYLIYRAINLVCCHWKRLKIFTHLADLKHTGKWKHIINNMFGFSFVVA